jgi:hypothetical protein
MGRGNWRDGDFAEMGSRSRDFNVLLPGNKQSNVFQPLAQASQADQCSGAI